MTVPPHTIHHHHFYRFPYTILRSTCLPGTLHIYTYLPHFALQFHHRCLSCFHLTTAYFHTISPLPFLIPRPYLPFLLGPFLHHCYYIAALSLIFPLTPISMYTLLPGTTILLWDHRFTAALLHSTCLTHSLFPHSSILPLFVDFYFSFWDSYSTWISPIVPLVHNWTSTTIPPPPHFT